MIILPDHLRRWTIESSVFLHFRANEVGRNGADRAMHGGKKKYGGGASQIWQR